MAHDDEYYLKRALLRRALVHLCVPMMAAMSVGVVYNIVNAGFIGSLHSTPLLSAITFGLPVFALMMAAGGVFGVGGGSAVSRLIGDLDTAPEPEAVVLRIRQLAAFAVWGAFALGVVVASVGLLTLHPIVHLLGADTAAAGPTALYVGVMFAFAPALVLAFAVEQVVRAEGAARASMTGLILSTVANLGLDVAFILVLRWGVAGAALAIGLSNVVTVAYLGWHLHTRGRLIRISPRSLWAHPKALRPVAGEVFGVGVSELLMSSFLIVSSLLLNNVAVAYGDAVLAGFGVALRVVQLPEFLCMGVFMGVLPLLAVSHGARDVARLRAAVRQSGVWIATLVLLFATPVFLFREQVLHLFSTSPDVTGIGAQILVAMLVSALFNGFTGLVIAIFQATGRALAATVMSVTQGLLFIPVLFVARGLWALQGVIWSATIAEALTFAVGTALFAAHRGLLRVPSHAPVAGTAAGTDILTTAV
jgi:putative MATE family efflux protein